MNLTTKCTPCPTCGQDVGTISVMQAGITRLRSVNAQLLAALRKAHDDLCGLDIPATEHGTRAMYDIATAIALAESEPKTREAYAGQSYFHEHNKNIRESEERAAQPTDSQKIHAIALGVSRIIELLTVEKKP